MRSFAKWSLVTGLVGAFGVGTYRAYAESLLSEAEDKPGTAATSFKAYLATAAVMAAAVVAIGAL